MLISLIGLTSSGKNTLADYLVLKHNFIRVYISTSHTLPPNTSTAIYFKNSSTFLDYITRNWRQNFITIDLKNYNKLIEFTKRPFVLIIGIESPLIIRYSRSVMLAISKGIRSISLEDFVVADDKALFGSPIPTTFNNDSTSTSNSSISLQPPSSTSSSSSNPPSSPLPSPSKSPSSNIFSIPSPNSTRPEPIAPMMRLATKILFNPHKNKELFYKEFEENFNGLKESLRPDWDTYFMLLACLASLRSNCMKRRVGAVLVREKRVVSTGYNGTPRGVKNCGEGGCSRCNSYTDGFGSSSPLSSLNNKEGEGEGEGGEVVEVEEKLLAMGVGLDECLCLHAEENALLEAGRERVSGGGTEGAVLYCNTCPCLRCTVKIVQCGVKEVVYSLSYSMDVASRKVLDEAGVGLRQIEMPAFPRG